MAPKKMMTPWEQKNVAAIVTEREYAEKIICEMHALLTQDQQLQLVQALAKVDMYLTGIPRSVERCKALERFGKQVD